MWVGRSKKPTKDIAVLINTRWREPLRYYGMNFCGFWYPSWDASHSKCACPSERVHCWFGFSQAVEMATLKQNKKTPNLCLYFAWRLRQPNWFRNLLKCPFSYGSQLFAWDESVDRLPLCQTNVTAASYYFVGGCYRPPGHCSECQGTAGMCWDKRAAPKHVQSAFSRKLSQSHPHTSGSRRGDFSGQLFDLLFKRVWLRTNTLCCSFF